VVVAGAAGPVVPPAHQAPLRQLLFAALHVVTGRVRRTGIVTSWQEATVLALAGQRDCREALATLVAALDGASAAPGARLRLRLPLLRDWLQPALILVEVLCRPFIVCPLNWVPATHLARVATLVTAPPGTPTTADADSPPLDEAALCAGTGAGTGAGGGPKVFSWPAALEDGRRLVGIVWRCYQTHLVEDPAHDGVDTDAAGPSAGGARSGAADGDKKSAYVQRSEMLRSAAQVRPYLAPI